MANSTVDTIANYRRCSERLRAKADGTTDLTLRLECERSAREFDELAANLERVAMRATEH